MRRIIFYCTAPLHAEAPAEIQGCLDDPCFDHDLGNGLVEQLDQRDRLIDIAGDILDYQGIRPGSVTVSPRGDSDFFIVPSIPPRLA